MKVYTLIIHHGYKQATSDHSLFVKSKDSSFTNLPVYVDDVILAYNSLIELKHMNDVPHQAFQIKDLGILKYLLGLEVEPSKQGIYLCRRKYCTYLLAYSSFPGSKFATTPSNSSIKLCHNNIPPLADIPTYRIPICRLVYLNTTRLNITLSLKTSVIFIKFFHCSLQCNMQSFMILEALSL